MAKNGEDTAGESAGTDRRLVPIEVGWRAQTDFPFERPYQSLSAAARRQPPFALFQASAAMYSERTAVIGLDGRLTFGELLRRSLALAARLHALRGEATQPVVGLIPQGVTQAVCVLACLRLGAPYVPLDPRHSAVHHRRIVLASGAGLVLCDRDTCAAAAVLGPVDCLVTGDENPGLEENSLPPLPDASALGLLIFTSGSTGLPKGVVHTQASMLSSAATVIDMLHLSAGDRFAVVASPSVITSSTRILGPLLCGATAVPLANGAPLPDLLRACAEAEVTDLGCYIGLARALARHPGAVSALRRLRTMTVYGDVVGWDDIELLRAAVSPTLPIANLYGATECDMTSAWFAPINRTPDAIRPSAGLALPDAECWLDLTELGQADEARGELLVAGGRLSTGYWRNDALTKACFEAHPTDPNRRIYRTGDIFRRLQDGTLEFLGRRDNQVKLHGWRIELEEIEAAARQIVGVAMAGVVARRGSYGVVESLALFVTTDAPGQPAVTVEHEVMTQLRSSLSRSMWPAEIHLLAELPRTQTGKLDRVRLGEIDLQLRERRQTNQAPTRPDDWPDDLSRRIVQVLAKELGGGALKSDDHFIDLGGDSFSAINVALAVEKIFGIDIDPSDILDDASIGVTVDKVRQLVARR